MKQTEKNNIIIYIDIKQTEMRILTFHIASEVREIFSGVICRKLRAASSRLLLRIGSTKSNYFIVGNRVREIKKSAK